MSDLDSTSPTDSTSNLETSSMSTLDSSGDTDVSNITASIVAAVATISRLTAMDSLGYICLGLVVMLLDAFILAVLISDRNLLKQSSLSFGIASGNFLQGVFLFWSGTHRLVNFATLNDLAWPSQCAALIFPLLFPLGLTCEASFLILGGVERYLSLGVPLWHRQNWSNRISWMVSGWIYAGCLLMMVAGIGLMFSSPDSFVTFQCSAPTVFGQGYVAVCSLFTAFGGVISAALTLTALIAGLRKMKKVPRLSGESGRLRRQLQLTKLMMMISACDFGLVAIPSFVSGLANFTNQITLPSYLRGNNMFYTNGANAIAVFIAFMVFNKNFRATSIKVLHLEKYFDVHLTNRVGPGTHAGTPGTHHTNGVSRIH